MIQPPQKLGSEPHLLAQCENYSPGLSSVPPRALLNLSVTAATVLTQLIIFRLDGWGHLRNVLLSPKCKLSDVLCLCRFLLWIPMTCKVKFTHLCVLLSHFPVSCLPASPAPSFLVPSASSVGESPASGKYHTLSIPSL